MHSPSEPLHILITGISGMLGRSLASRLASSGHKVSGIDLVPHHFDDPNIRVEAADMRDVHRLYRIVENVPPIDVVVHGGGISGSMVMRDNPAQVADININGTMNLLEVMRLHRIPRLVQCSTIMAYGPVPMAPVQEDRPLAPANVYGATKAACEALVTSYGAEFGLSAAMLRIAHVYGPTRTTYCPVRAMIAGALENSPVAIRDKPETARQLVYADDVVRAIELAVSDRQPGCVVANVAPGAEWSMAEVAEMIRRQVGPLSVTYGEGAAHGDYQTAALSIDRARERWGWVPEISLADGIARFAVALKA
ncbi:NAD(P)-dependent oxidoreductase [Telmatospirillum sp. J64-1]|uniref:NAD-dependent epimerase/dehydratase family protein n=1 Tax=Telmatospirillum sp. J64-1 TaxID=2502183 RepID=UPI00115DF1E0|nr:NAD(P)-dependent oxidoreductase [Telmatospirillum sp. J64-1]